jgi:hypothetical protein
MDSIDTSAKIPSAAFDPPYVLLETDLPNSGGKEFLPIRNYNPLLVKPKKDDKAKKNDDEEDAAATDFADQKVIRIKTKKQVDLQEVQRKDLFFHPEHGYLKVTQLKVVNEDDEEKQAAYVHHPRQGY